MSRIPMSYKPGGPPNLKGYPFFLDAKLNRDVPPWFVECKRNEAEKLLSRRCPNTSVLLMRPSNTAGQFALTVQTSIAGNIEFNHYSVVCSKDGFYIDIDNKHRTQRTLSEIIEIFVRLAGSKKYRLYGIGDSAPTTPLTPPSNLTLQPGATGPPVAPRRQDSSAGTYLTPDYIDDDLSASVPPTGRPVQDDLNGYLTFHDDNDADLSAVVPPASATRQILDDRAGYLTVRGDEDVELAAQLSAVVLLPIGKGQRRHHQPQPPTVDDYLPVAGDGNTEIPPLMKAPPVPPNDVISGQRRPSLPTPPSRTKPTMSSLRSATLPTNQNGVDDDGYLILIEEVTDMSPPPPTEKAPIAPARSPAVNGSTQTRTPPTKAPSDYVTPQEDDMNGLTATVPIPAHRSTASKSQQRK